MGPPKSTICRFCGGGGEVYKGAHIACRNEHYRQIAAAKRGPNHCRRCEVVIEDGIKLCSDCAEVSRKEAIKRYEIKLRPCKRCACGCGDELPRGFTGRFLDGHNPRLKQPQVRARRRKAVAAKKAHPMGQIVVGAPRERPFAQPRKAAIDLPPTNPNGVEPRRIPPVGAAGWSVSEARRFG